jgi:hypothetical protein
VLNAADIRLDAVRRALATMRGVKRDVALPELLVSK